MGNNLDMQSQIREAYNQMRKMSDDELKRAFDDIGGIKKENYDLAVKLLRSILTDEGCFELVQYLSNDEWHPNGCIGAIDPAIFLARPSHIAELTHLVANNIRGVDLYTLWNDCARRDYQRFIINIWALQSGVYKQSEIDENFKINHYDFNNLSDYQALKWLDRVKRRVVIPFVFSNDIIKEDEYLLDKRKVEPFGEDFKKYVKANRAYHLFKTLITQSGLIVNNEIHTNGNNEISISMVMPTYQSDNYGNLKLCQPKNGEVETFTINVNQLSELLIARPEIKGFDQIVSEEDFGRIIHFLKSAKNQFLPSISTMRAFPINDTDSFFVNNNNKRYGELINLSQFKSGLAQNGFIKLSYILGLFSKSEKESKNASEYLKQHIIGKISPDKIHKLYGGLNPKNGYNKDFAQFFMIHYAQNPHCFENDEGVDFTEQIYNNFDEILEFRPEKKIVTTTNRERLTPEDALSCIQYFQNSLCYKFGLPEKDSKYVDVLVKYTTCISEIRWAVDKLKQAIQIPEDEVKIPYVEDNSNGKCKFRVLKKGDPEIAITGRKTNCCFMYGGESSSSLENAITSPNSSVVVFESKKGYTQGWVWYDEKNGVFVIDNLEGNPERNEDDHAFADDLIKAVLRYADTTMIALKKKGLPCKSVNLGLRYLDNCMAMSLEKYLNLGFIKKEDDPKIDYPRENQLYTDAKNQYVLSDSELLRLHTSADVYTETNVPDESGVCLQ